MYVLVVRVAHETYYNRAQTYAALKLPWMKPTKDAAGKVVLWDIELRHIAMEKVNKRMQNRRGSPQSVPSGDYIRQDYFCVQDPNVCTALDFLVQHPLRVANRPDGRERAAFVKNEHVFSVWNTKGKFVPMDSAAIGAAFRWQQNLQKIINHKKIKARSVISLLDMRSINATHLYEQWRRGVSSLRYMSFVWMCTNQ